MIDKMRIPHFFNNRTSFFKTAPFIAAGLVLGIWLTYTPGGLLGKADAIAYAICHRIPPRSFFIGDRQGPLCARCSGMYLGALIGLLYQMRGSRRGGMPARKIWVLLGIFFLAFAVDGLNSYLKFYPFFKPLYETQNWMRLVTGTGMGICMAAVLMPVFNETVWPDWNDQPLLHSWKQMAAIMLMAGVADLAFLSGNPLLLFPVALLSTGTVILLLGMIYSIVWIMITRKENTFHSLKQMAGFLTAGFTTALVQIGIMDLGRFILTGTWGGFFSG